MDTNIEHYDFQAKETGPHLLVFGAIHGNETCGPKAIEKIMGQLKSGELELKKGRVTFVPLCNPRAYKQNVRQTEMNLNRVFKKHGNPQAYEEHLANALIPFVDQCDYFLDIHSFTAEGNPFVIQKNEDKVTDAFAKIVGPMTIMFSATDTYKGNSESVDGKTLGYAQSVNKTAVLVECGQHLDPNAPIIAEQAIMNSFIHLSLVAIPSDHVQPSGHLFVLERDMVVKPANGGELVKAWRHMDMMTKGEVLAFTGDNQPITAPYDGYVLLPKSWAEPGQEWFFLGVQKHDFL